MSSFPILKTGAVAQYPATREVRAEATVLRFLDGTEQRYRVAGQPGHRWIIHLDLLDEEEIAGIEKLFEEAQGRCGSFSFTDPWDSRTYEDCSFDQEEIEGRRSGESRCGTVVVIRENRN